MTAGRTSRDVVCWLLGGILAAGLLPVMNVADADDIQARLLPLWAGYRSEVATAEIRYRHTLLLCGPNNLTADEFLKRMAEVDLRQHEDLIPRIVSAFLPELHEIYRNPEIEFARWEDKILLVRGDERRSTGQWQDHLLQQALHICVDRANEQTKVYRLGTCPYGYEDLNWFRDIPDDSILGLTTSYVGHDDLIAAHYAAAPDQPGSWVLLSQNDGLPRRWDLVDPESGLLRIIKLFEGYTDFPGEVSMPTVKIQAGFDEGGISTIRISVVSGAEFNQNLPDARFLMNAKAGTGWFDHRDEEPVGGVWSVPVIDVARYFTVRSGPRLNEPEQPMEGAAGFGGRSLIFIVNGLALIVMGLVLWRRHA